MKKLEKLSRVMSAACAWPGRIANWCVLLIMAFTILAVLFAQLRFGVIVTWDRSIPVLGDRLTLVGLTELQWHLFGLMVMLGGAYALHVEGHIRVDLFYSRLSPRGQCMVDLIGDLLFLLPFCLVTIYFSIGYVERSFISGERSNYGGLIDRYVVKSLIPIGLGLLAVAAASRVVRGIIRIFNLSDVHGDGSTGEEESK